MEDKGNGYEDLGAIIAGIAMCAGILVLIWGWLAYT